MLIFVKLRKEVYLPMRNVQIACTDFAHGWNTRDSNIYGVAISMKALLRL